MSDTPTIPDNESIYDEQIFPLMAEIIAICKAHGIPMLASFEYAPEQLCTTYILPKGSAPELEQAAGVIKPKPQFAAFTITRVKS